MIKLCELKNNTRVKLTRYGFVVSGDKNDIAVTECTFINVDGDRAVPKINWHYDSNIFKYGRIKIDLTKKQGL